LKKYKSLKIDLRLLFEVLKEDPFKGNPIDKDCFKIRLSITDKHKGKSGGARIISCVKIKKSNVYLLTIYDKSQRKDISTKELNQLLKYFS
jgi:hypothetical protein